VTDNTEQAQIYESLKLVRARSMAVLHRFAKRARQYANLEMVGRSHNVPAQTITLGKRFANWGEEFLCAFWKLENLLDNTTFRGIKGPMGTQQDLINKMGDLETALGFEQTMQDLLHLPRQVFDSVGQVYPRSLDFEVISLLAQLSSAPGNMAITIRLMAGAGLATEGFAKSQKGSAAMPHKMNPRTSERIDGMVDVIGGYVCMAQALLGNQWNEGDVSCSIVRRVALPDSFFAIDGLLQATMIVLDEMGVYEKAIAKELKTALPFLSTTNILRAFQDKGMGREDAHTMIRNSAIDAIQAGEPETFITRLLANEGMPLSADEVYAQITEPNHGATLEQIEGVCLMIDNIIAEHREVLEYKPEPIL
jgi:adenylosuccinate lyase